MTTNARALAAALNREIVDDQKDRITIHTHSIRLTQANLPYQPVADKRLPSEKHFSVYADQIVLAGLVQNPGRNIELHAREIIVEEPTTLDVAGAYADKDFPPGKVPIQQDDRPGADGTNGANATEGGAGGSIVIDARRVVNKTEGAHALTVTDAAAIAARIFAEHPPKVDDTTTLPTFEVGRTKMVGDTEVVIELEKGRVEGLSHFTLESSRVDTSTNQVGVRLSLPRLTVTGNSRFAGTQRISTQPFGCRIDAAATVNADGSVSALQSDLSLVSAAALKLPIPFFEGVLSAGVLAMIRDHIAAHVGKSASEPLLNAFSKQLRGAALTVLAGGGRGGRGQDGHAGVRGEPGADGAKTEKSGVSFDTGPSGFPEEAYGQNGLHGGRAGSPGLSKDGGKGGLIALNVMDPVDLAVIYSIAGGEGGVPASAGDRGPGGHGGAGTVCHMYNRTTGRPTPDEKAPDGKDGALGGEATSAGSTGATGPAGGPLKFNGAPFTGAAPPPYSFTALAQDLSLSQLLIAQNAADQDFLNAKSEPEFVAVADAYTWLVQIDEPFTDSHAAIDAARVSVPEQKVRAGIHNSAVVSLMRLQQGLDYYGHSYNWAPVLNLNNLVTRTSQIINLGKVVEDQFNRYLDKTLTDKQRMQAFGQAKQEIDRKLAEFVSEIEKLQPQIDAFDAEVAKYSESLRKQRTLLLEGQLKFKDELIEYLRKENDLGFEGFLDMIGTLISCAAGVVEGIGGIKTAIDAVKKAGEFSKQVKGIVEVLKKAKATIDSIKKAYATITEYVDSGNPNAAKIMVDGGEFDKFLKKYLGKFDAAGELRKALAYYQTLAQARNMAAYNYTTLVAQVLSIQAQHDQLYSGIQHINAEIAVHQDNVLAIYTAYLKDAYEDVQRNLLRNIYQENRAYQYWSLKDRPLQTNDLNIATQAAAHDRLMADIDAFRENNEAFSDFNQKLVVSADRYPNEFAAMPESRSLTFELDIRKEPGFENMRFIIARSFTLEFPEVADGDHVLFVNLVHSGQAVLNSDTNLDKLDAVHVFSHRPRVLPYKIDYKEPDNTAGGNLGEGDQGYIGLSPFTLWRIDFGLKGNEWLDLKVIKTVKLTFSGRTLGPAARSRRPGPPAGNPIPLG